MNISDCFAKAEKHRLLMDKAFVPLNKKLDSLLDDGFISFQPSDGWCLVLDGQNIPARAIDFDKLFKMSKEDALEYLIDRRV